MFNQLLANNDLTKKQKGLAESLSKKFSPKNKGDLEKANELLFSLFYTENLNAIQICLDVLTKIRFDGNFNLWAFIQPSYCLKYFLSDDTDEKVRITEMLKTEVRSEWDDDDEHQEFLQKILDGELVHASEEKLEQRKNDPDGEYTWRTIVLQNYLHILALGATGKINIDKAMSEIHSNLKRLKELVS